MNRDPLLSMNDAAEILAISRRHLAFLIARGDGPPIVRLGGRVLIRPDSLAAWLDQREQQAA
jgi:excisionase family DNA binding protein